MATYCVLDCDIPITDGTIANIFACQSTDGVQEITACQQLKAGSTKFCGVPIDNWQAKKDPQCERKLTSTSCAIPTQGGCFIDAAETTLSNAPPAAATPSTSAIENGKPETSRPDPTASSTSTANALPTGTGAPDSPSVTANGTVDAQNQGVMNKKGISSGAAAGIGIGGAIAGAVVAGLILLFLFARYKKRRQQQQPNAFATHLPNYNSDLGRQEKGISTPTKSGLIVAEMPQPVEDDAIIGALSRLRDSIKNHVQSFYHTSTISTQSLNQAVLSGVANDTGIQVSELHNLLATPASRIPALRLCVAWIILSRCDGRGPPGTSLLPEEAAAVAAMITSVDYKDTRKAALASKLKVISGALLQSHTGQAQPLQSANLDHRIEQAVLTANDFLTPFLDSSADATSEKRLRNLESIVRRASQLAMLLFSQPSIWALNFGGSSTARSGTMLVFPGLLETASEDGIVRQPPRQFHEPEVTVIA
ncbi:hypothetical protein BKA65DRAFT_555954 [Rhexocercosporidium sp. MPI-PUGE-AT-0058]|nr:hypothetical protein BKA65DRAFT_555954 [Rhexocercosporidium sp. MPI-PUGE-AT-0058]